MKFLCPSCRELSEIAAIRAEGAHVRFTCARCGSEAMADTPTAPSSVPRGENVVPLRPNPFPLAAPEDPFFVPEDRCPKCVAPRSREVRSCARCGLDFDCFQPEHLALSPLLAAAWEDVWGRWDEEAAHERFRQIALTEGDLVSAARLYQIRLARSHGDVHAEHGRAEVLRLASRAVVFERPMGPESGSTRARRGWMLATGFAGVILVLLWMLTTLP